MSIFTGSCVALITPFTSDGVNYDALGKLIEFHLENHTDALLVNGTTGEPATMSDSEKTGVLEFAVQKVAGRIPVIAGTGANSTAKAIENSLLAQKLGADALLVVTPYYNKCTQGGLVAHYCAIADAVDLPIIVYNVPGRTGVNVLPATMRKLADHKNIAGIKEASGNIEQICETARLCPDIDLYSGNDDHILPLLALGGKGVISVLANVMPQQTHDLVASYFEGDIARSRQLQFMMNPLVKALFSEVNPIPVKTACNLMGFEAGSLRLPLTEMSEAPLAVLKKEMAALGLIK
jgi:4-hydroxy-tetrahydrodipicolinate synthase